MVGLVVGVGGLGWGGVVRNACCGWRAGVGGVVGVGGLVWGGVVRNACCVWRAGLGEFRVFGCRAGGSCRADVLGTLAFWLAWCSISKGEGAWGGWGPVGSTRWGVCARACRAGSSCCSY